MNKEVSLLEELKDLLDGKTPIKISSGPVVLKNGGQYILISKMKPTHQNYIADLESSDKELDRVTREYLLDLQNEGAVKKIYLLCKNHKSSLQRLIKIINEEFPQYKDELNLLLTFS